VHSNGVLHGSLQQFLVAVGANRDAAFYIPWELTAIDVLAAHGYLFVDVGDSLLTNWICPGAKGASQGRPTGPVGGAGKIPCCNAP